MSAAAALTETRLTPRAASVASAVPTTRRRQYELDALRLLSVFAVFVFHVNSQYSNPPRGLVRYSAAAAAVVAAIPAWRMPMLFFVAGLAVLPGLGTKTPRVYLFARMRRLLVPFVLGCLCIAPVQLVLEESLRGRSVPLEPRTGYYWFLSVLGVLTAAGLPLACALRRVRAQLTAVRAPWIAIALCSIPTLLACLPWRWLPTRPVYADHDAKTLLSYAAFFGIGLALSFLPAVRDDLRRYWPVALIPGVAATLAPLFGAARAGTTHTSVFVAAVGMTGLVIGGYGLMQQICTRPFPALARWSPYAFPFYILHGIMLALVSTVVLPLRLPLSVEIWTVAALTALATVLSARVLLAYRAGRWALGSS